MIYKKAFLFFLLPFSSLFFLKTGYLFANPPHPFSLQAQPASLKETAVKKARRHSSKQIKRQQLQIVSQLSDRLIGNGFLISQANDWKKSRDDFRLKKALGISPQPIVASNNTDSASNNPNGSEELICDGDSYIKKISTRSIRKIERKIDKFKNMLAQIDQYKIQVNNQGVDTDNINKELQELKAQNPSVEMNKCKATLDEIQDRLKTEETCKEKLKSAKEARSEYTKNCSRFLGGNFKCSAAIDACDKCPNAEDDEEYNCVRIHNKSECPVLSGKELREAKENKERINDEKKDLKEKISDLEQDAVSKENDLKRDLAELEEEFIKTRRDLEREAEEQKADLENQLRESKSEITKSIAESIAQVQAEIDNFLKVAHSFENAITKAYMEYRKERRQIFLECEAHSQGRLAKYKQRRKAAIQTGSLQMSLSDLTKKGRVSFAQKDNALAKKYKAQCLAKRKPDFKDVDIALKQKLRVIEQQKEQYQDQLKKAQQKIVSLNNQAAQAQNKLVQDYAQNMSKIVDSHQKESLAAHQAFLKAKGKLMLQAKGVTLLRKQLLERRHELGRKETELARERELISYLKSKGVNDDEAGRSEFAEAASSLADYENAVAIALDDCKCANKDKLKDECGELQKMPKVGDSEQTKKNYRKSFQRDRTTNKEEEEEGNR